MASPLDKTIASDAIMRPAEASARTFPVMTMDQNFELEHAVAIQASAKRRGFAGRWPVRSHRRCSPRRTRARSPWPISAARRSICRTLAEAFPDDPVIAEEDAAELKTPGKRGHPRTGAPACSRCPIRNGRRSRASDRRGASLSLDRPRRRQPVQRAILDARPDRRHQGVSPRRAICGRAGADRRGPRRRGRAGVSELVRAATGNRASGPRKCLAVRSSTP